MNRDGIFRQWNSSGRGEPAAERQSCSLADHAHTKGHPPSLMLPWIAHTISWSRVCVSEELNWQLNLHSSLPWGMAVTHSGAFVYPAKQPGLLGLESSREPTGGLSITPRSQERSTAWPQRGSLGWNYWSKWMHRLSFSSYCKLCKPLFQPSPLYLAFNNYCTLMFFPLA